MTITTLRPPDALSTTIQPWTLPDETPWRTRVGRHLRIREIGVLTILALAGYIASAMWTRFGLHYWINDALNRTDDALYVTVGRDPHIGAIGFYWPPLPQLMQLPFVPFLRPFGEEILAGPLMTACCMAATIPVLARIGRRLALRRSTIFLICLAFAITPDMVYTASNGMAESPFILSGAVTMLGFLAWIETRATKDLLVFTVGLCMLVMTRLEGPFIALAVVAVAVFRARDLRRSLWDGILLMLPPTFCYLLWLAVQWVLLKDPLFFLHQNGGGGPGVGGSFWLPSHLYHNPVNCILWVLGWVAILAPVLFVVAASILARPLSQKTRGGLGILAATGAVLAIQAYTAFKGPVFGNPRYFVMAAIFGAVGALWLASNRPSLLFRSWNLGLVTLLIVAAGTGSYSLTSGRVTHEEAECSYFQYGVAHALPFLGRTQTGRYACSRPSDGLNSWQQADAWIDSTLSSHDRILADNASNYSATLFSTRPNLFVVRNDRDWGKTIANPFTVTYILTQSTSATAAPASSGPGGTDLGAELLGLDRAGWHLVKSFSGAQNLARAGTFVQIWHFVPSPAAGVTPRGTESAIQ